MTLMSILWLPEWFYGLNWWLLGLAVVALVGAFYLIGRLLGLPDPFGKSKSTAYKEDFSSSSEAETAANRPLSIDRRVKEIHQILKRGRVEHLYDEMRTLSTAVLGARQDELRRTVDSYKDRMGELQQENQALGSSEKQLRGDLDSVKEQLKDAEAERALLFSVCVYLADGDEPLREYSTLLLDLHEVCFALQQKFSGIPPRSVLPVQFNDETDAAMVNWVIAHRKSVEELLKYRVCGDPLIVGPHGGEKLSGGTLAGELKRVLYSSLVRPHIGGVLRRIQKYLLLHETMSAAQATSGESESVATQLNALETRLFNTLSQLKIEPLKLRFLKPLTSEFDSVVSVVQVPVESVYPRSEIHASSPLTILDVEKWGYLDEGGRPWDGEKARVFVSE